MAEPYFGVRQPSDVVVMENIVRGDTLGKIGAINAKYELLPRGQYEYHIPESHLKPVDLNPQEESARGLRSGQCGTDRAVRKIRPICGRYL